jgi:integrase
MIQVKLRYVYEDTDRHGNLRTYFWRAGHAKVRMRETPGSPAFLDHYNRLMAAAKHRSDTGAKLTDAKSVGTMRWLLTRYLGSSHFAALAPTTQRARRANLESCLLEPVHPGALETFAQFPVDRLTAKAIRVLRDRKSATPVGAQNRIKAIRVMFVWAVENDLMHSNPARDVRRPTHRSDGHHTWTQSEAEQFQARHPRGTTARLAYAIFACTGVRKSDAIELGHQHLTGGWLTFRPRKGNDRWPVTVEIPVMQELADELAAGAAGPMTFLLTSRGRPFTVAGFGNWFRDRCNEAGLPHCSAHGLRKAAATLAAESGATPHMLMAIFGWSNPRQADSYTRAASRRQMAGDGMALMAKKFKP